MATTDPVTSLAAKLVTSLTKGTFVRLVLTHPRSSAGDLQQILGRAVEIQGQLHLSLTQRYPKRDVTRNVPLGEVETWMAYALRDSFRSALLCTVNRDWQFSVDPKGLARIVPHKPSRRTLPSRAHDRARRDLLGAEAQPWLHALGITDATGKARPAMASKHQQIRRYVEILSHLVRDAGWTADQSVTVADMGSGKGYLTFAAWHSLRTQFRIRARVIGVEARLELVEAANAVGRRLACDGLEFVAGDIANTPLPPLDGLIALHACNTATDDAIRRGVECGVRLLLVAPCCHQELRPQLRHPAPLAAPLRHGILAERMAEWLTDALRALYLEWAGYETKVFEFVPSEHTPKNLMISAVRRRPPFASPEARRQILELKAFFGLTHHALDPLLEPDAAPTANEQESKTRTTPNTNP